MRAAFQELAAGNFASGLAKLNEQPQWHDDNNDLDGPFCLSFPDTAGWGEALLTASLLKRHAASLSFPVEVFANPQVSSILRHDEAFRVTSVQSGQVPRSPLPILRAALTGDLLQQPFVPLCGRAGSPQSEGTRRRIGIAWASIDKGRTLIRAKSIPPEEFRTIIDGIDAAFISFQRHPKQAESNIIFDKIAPRTIPEDVINATDQTLLVNDILGLDCIVTISTTTAHIAASFGIPVILLAAQRKSQQWFWRAQAEHGACLYPTVHVLIGQGEKGDWWQQCLAPAKAKLSDLLSN